MLFVSIVIAAIISGVALWSSRKPDMTAGYIVLGALAAHFVGPLVIGLAGGHWTHLFGPLVQSIIIISAWLVILGAVAGVSYAGFLTAQNRVKAVPALAVAIGTFIFAAIEPHFRLINIAETALVVAIVMGVASVYYRQNGVSYPWVNRSKRVRGEDAHDIAIGAVEFVTSAVGCVVSAFQHAVDATFSFIGRVIAAGKRVIAHVSPVVDEMFPQEYALQIMGTEGERALNADELTLVARNTQARVQAVGHNRRVAYVEQSQVEAVCDVLNAIVIGYSRGANGISYVTLCGVGTHNAAAQAPAPTDQPTPAPETAREVPQTRNFGRVRTGEEA